MESRVTFKTKNRQTQVEINTITTKDNWSEYSNYGIHNLLKVFSTQAEELYWNGVAAEQNGDMSSGMYTYIYIYVILSSSDTINSAILYSRIRDSTLIITFLFHPHCHCHQCSSTIIHYFTRQVITCLIVS